MGVSVGIRIFADYWLAAWPKREFDLSYGTYVWMLWLLLGLCAFFIILRAITFSHYGSIIAIKIFKEFLKNLLQKSMKFFDSTSIGQILNLSSKDTDYMDVRLNGTYYSFFSIFFSLIGTFVILIISNYFSAILIAVLIVIFSWLIVIYLRSSMELRRLE